MHNFFINTLSRVNKSQRKLTFVFLVSTDLAIAKNITQVSDLKSDLKIESQSFETKIDEEHEFKVSGGKAPYIFKTSLGLIHYKNDTATFISPSDPGEAVISVKDSAGASTSVKVMILPNKKSTENSDE